MRILFVSIVALSLLQASEALAQTAQCGTPSYCTGWSFASSSPVRVNCIPEGSMTATIKATDQTVQIPYSIPMQICAVTCEGIFKFNPEVNATDLNNCQCVNAEYNPCPSELKLNNSFQVPALICDQKAADFICEKLKPITTLSSKPCCNSGPSIVMPPVSTDSKPPVSGNTWETMPRR